MAITYDEAKKWLDRSVGSETQRRDVASWLTMMARDLENITTDVQPPLPEVPYFVKSGCCGFKEIDNLASGESPLQTLKTLFPSRGSVRFGVPVFVFFSQARVESMTHTYFTHLATINPRPYGQEFAGFLRAQGLGEVTYLGEGKNKTGRMLGGWVWKVDKEPLRVFIDKGLEEKGVWNVTLETARGQSNQPGPMVGGEQTSQPSGENRGGIGGGLAETPSGNPSGA